jgi:hypothetical protein
MPDYQFNTNLGPAAQQGTSLRDLIGTAGGLQAYQQAQQVNPLLLQKAQLELQQAQQVNPLELKAKQLIVQQAEQTNPLKLKQEQTATEEKQFDLAQKKAQASRAITGALATSDAFRKGDRKGMMEELASSLKELERAGFSPSEALTAITPLADMTHRNPTAVAPMLENINRQSVSPESRLALQTGQVTTNAAGQLVNVKPALNQINVMGGAQQSGAPAAPAMSANPTTAQAGLLNKATETAGADWAQTSQDANTAQGRIAIYQNIKRLTPEAFTGVGGERKKFLSGLAQSIGIPAEELATSSTDELTKNSKLLALAGGNTDAARSIAELATPNAKMTKDAILRVADQLIGIEKLKEAKANWLAPYLNNPAEYVRKQQEFNKYSDFRLFQEMTPEEVAKLKASMSPAQQREMSQKIREAKTLGIIQ